MQSEAPEHKSIVDHTQLWQLSFCCVEPKIERDRSAMRNLGLVTLRLVSFFRRGRFDLCNQVSISIHLDCISSALHRFSGIIKLADHLACMAVAMSTADNKFTAASIYAMENRHHAHSCSGLDFATRAFFQLLGGCPCICCASAVWSGVWHQPLSVQCSLLSLLFQSLVACSFFYLALGSLSVCDLLYSCSTVPCRSVIEVVSCFGSATLSHVCWVFLRNVVCCGTGLLGKSCYSQVVPVLRGAVSHVAVSSRASGQASGATFVLCQSANESEVQHCASQMSSVICYITDQCSVRTMCSCKFWVRNTTNVRGKRA